MSRADIPPTLPRLAALDFAGELRGDGGLRGASFAGAALGQDIHVSIRPAARGTAGFLPNGSGRL